MFRKPSVLVSLSNAGFSGSKGLGAGTWLQGQGEEGLTHKTEGSSSKLWSLRARGGRGPDSLPVRWEGLMEGKALQGTPSFQIV